MNTVYIVMTEGRKIQRVFRDKNSATVLVNAIAKQKYGITPKDTPLDFGGTLMTYGWADKCWWQREVVY
jgi:hypothetical protein